LIIDKGLSKGFERTTNILKAKLEKVFDNLKITTAKLIKIKIIQQYNLY
jgi:hypothetical protein